MTAPNKMAKRAAAGTLALAVCLGGGVLGSGAANAAPLATATVTSAVDGTATTVVPSTANQAVAGVTVTLADTEWKVGDRLLFALPDGYTFSSLPTVAVKETLAGTGATAAPTFSTAFFDNDNSIVAEQQVEIKFTNAMAGTAADSDYTFTLSNLKVTAPSGAVGGAINVTARKQAFVAGVYQPVAPLAGGTVAVGTLNNVATVGLTAGQSIITGGAVTKLSPVTVTEVGTTGLANGTYTLVLGGGAKFGALDVAGTADDVTIKSAATGTTITGVSLNANSDEIEFTLAGTSASDDSLTFTNLRVTDTAAGASTLALQDSATFETLATNKLASFADPVRLGGLDRYATAASIGAAVDAARATSTVVLTNSGMTSTTGVSIDALSSSYIAGAQAAGAPILLTEANSLPSATENAIRSILGATGNVIIVGGTSAVSADVQKAVKALEPTAGAYTVTRISGSDRYDSAAQAAVATGATVANYTHTSAGSTALKTAFLASGSAPADALAVAQVAYDARHPILLTEKNTVPQVTLDAIDSLGIKQVIVAGGEAVIAKSVETQLTAAGIKVIRVAGADRFETSAELIKAATSNHAGGINANLTAGAQLHLANGYALADASVAAPLAAQLNRGLLFTDRNSLSPSTEKLLKDAPLAEQVVGIGFSAALPQSTLVAANIAANS